MRNFITLLILLSIHISLLAQSTGINLPVSTLPNTMLDVNGSVAFREGTALVLANGANNDVALTNYSFFRVTGPTAAFSVTGFSSGTDGRTLTIVNATTQTMTISHLTGSVVANQINTGGSAIVLLPNGVITMIYNTNTTKWMVSATNGSDNGSAWRLSGNASTIDGTNFIGTTDNIPLSMRVNNIRSARLTSTGESYWGYEAGASNTATGLVAIGYQAAYSNTTGINNAFVGYRAGNSNTTGGYNAAFGRLALANNTTLSYNSAFGASALQANTGGSQLSAFGYNALGANTTGTGNAAFGANALSTNTSGYNNTALGSGNLFGNTTGHSNTAVGAYVLGSNTTGFFNTATGNSSMTNNTTGNSNTANGTNTLLANTIGNNNVAMGWDALGDNTSGNNNTAIGTSALPVNTTASGNTAVGYRTLYTTTTGWNNIAMGDSAGYLNTLGYQNAFIGNQAGYNNTTGYINQFIGDGAGYSNTTGWRNTAIGFQAGYYMTTGQGNILLGRYAGYSDVTNKLTGDKNVAIGDEAGKFLTTGYQNAFMGDDAGLNTTTGYHNVAIGPIALNNNTTGNGNVAIGKGAGTTATGSENTFVGSNAGYYTSSGIYNTYVGYTAGVNTTIGNQNTFVGHSAGSVITTGGSNTLVGYQAGNTISTGSSNIAIGNQAQVPTATASNQLSIGNLIYGTGLNGTGATVSTGNIGIATTTPQYKLDIDAKTGSSGNPLRLQGLNAGTTTDSIITSSAGILRRMATNSLAWTLTGNTGTTPPTTVGAAVATTNYVGTADASNVAIATNGVSRMLIDQSGNAWGGGPDATPTNMSIASPAVNSFAWGGGNTVTEAHSATFGLSNTNGASRSIVFGWGNSLSTGTGQTNRGTILGGNSNTVSGGATYNSMINGSQMTVTGSCFESIISGFASTVTSSQKVLTVGQGNTLNGATYSAVFGLGNSTSSLYCLMQGSSSTINATADYGVALGQSNIIAAGHSNAMAIGKNVTTTASDQMAARFLNGYRFQSNSGGTTGVAVAAGGGSWTSISDRRSKEHIQDIHYGLSTVMRLRPTIYNYIGNTYSSLGFIAQEVKEVLPEVVEQTMMGPTKDYLGVKYTEMIPVLTKAIQEQQAQIEALTKENAALKAKVGDLDALKAEVEKIKKAIGIDTSAKR